MKFFTLVFAVLTNKQNETGWPRARKRCSNGNWSSVLGGRTDRDRDWVQDWGLETLVPASKSRV